MNIDQTLEQLAHLQCPTQVDVTDRVMAQVASKPYMINRREHSARATWFKRIGISAAAAVALLLVVNVTSLYTRSYDEEDMGTMMAQVNDYSSWNTVEQVATPYDFLYEER